jgi:hypothetical protein
MSSMDRAVSLRDALYELAAGKETLNAEVLDDVVRKYPKYAEELTSFAVELALSALREKAAEAAEAAIDYDGKVSDVVSRALSRFHNRRHAVKTAGSAEESTRGASSSTTSLFIPEEVFNPFSSMSRETFRDVAKRMNANPLFMTKVRERQIEPSTITDGFRRRLASEVGVPLEVIAAHLAAAPATSTHQRFKADDKPQIGAKQSFEEAVRTSSLTEEQQRHLLSL